ncbi:MAG: UDP-N-acetylglucosamine--N-acetylmuramyl-(pentapeptide) pyrophosphoryl-undecaprenol N-acetylglucosamine transferase [Clostridia bacterium]|nr:UDP-N-acetylglucosamine--N-acetylmuramyl-(pentapeptide) pyrophosphoryl-undecaprenol N-acetylglucosamine transferase [Clostridia bacterium]
MKVIIAAAGTGGHINPGIAIANKIKEEEKKSEIIFLGTVRGLENDLVPRAGYTLKTVEAHGYGRRLNIENIKNVLKNFKGIKETKKIIKEFKPDIIIGTGGYISAIACMAAKKYKVPVILHESNAFPGASVKMFAKKVDAVLVGFEDAKKRLSKAKKVVVTGTPTKIKNIKMDKEEKVKIKKELGFKDKEKPLILVYGGSQGAKSINETLMEIITKKLNKNYQIMWAAGPNQYDIIKEELEKKDININNIENIKIVPYIYNMEEIMNISDLLVCRSGAMTITEISLLRKTSNIYTITNSSRKSSRV